MTLRAYWDIGGTGNKADATDIWVVQFIGKTVHVLDYYEAIRQELGDHLAWLRASGYEKALCILPHDGANNEKVYRVSYESAIRDAGFQVRTEPNLGKGAASTRIESIKRVFPSCWFEDEKTAPGREALGWYHEKRDEVRGIGLGPEHDWSSHGSDAFGLMAVHFEQHKKSSGSYEPIAYKRLT
jgi:phage terminase large subunit